MSLVNFSLPYQSATMAPFLYTGPAGGHTTPGSNLRLNAVLPSGSVPGYNEAFRNEPYVPPVKYQHQHQQRRQTVQRRSQEVYTEHTSFSSTQDSRYAVYNQDFRRTQPRQQQHQQLLQQQQQQMKPPPPSSPSSFQQQSHRAHSPEPVKSRTEDPENYPERPNG